MDITKPLKNYMIIVFLVLSVIGYYKITTNYDSRKVECDVVDVQYSNTTTGSIKNYIVDCSSNLIKAGSFVGSVSKGSRVEVVIKEGFFGDDVTIVSVSK